MDDETKWNLNAPQNDTEDGQQNDPPKYEHYHMQINGRNYFAEIL